MSRDGSEEKAARVQASPNRILKICAVVLIFLFLIVTLISSKEATLSLDPKRADATVQRYLSALLKGDHLSAAKFFAPESLCTVQDLDRVYSIEATRVELVKTEITGERAEVSVKVEYGSGDPFATNVGEDHTFRLTRTGEQWLLESIPWPLYDCGLITK